MGGVMDLRVARLVGILLLLAGFALLIFAPAQFSAVHLFGGLALLLAGVPFLAGTLGVPPRVAQARQAAAHSPRTVSPTNVSARTYGSQTGRGRMLVLFGLMAGLAVVAIALALSWSVEDGLPALALMVVPSAGTAVFLAWYARRYRGLWVRVDSLGISSRQYVGTVTMRWDQVVALTTRTSRHGLRTYDVWSDHGRISFHAGGLDDADELAALVSETTGLAWSPGD
jgi:hypothetical protein